MLPGQTSPDHESHDTLPPPLQSQPLAYKPLLPLHSRFEEGWSAKE